MAYINHDIDDAVRYGLLCEGNLPREEIGVLGPTGSARIDRRDPEDLTEAKSGNRRSTCQI